MSNSIKDLIEVVRDLMTGWVLRNPGKPIKVQSLATKSLDLQIVRLFFSVNRTSH